MAKIYYEAVKSGKRTLDSVPTRWRAAGAAMLDKADPNTQEG